jgi:predicted anti-sigma-YlaC factor YlaD
MAKKCKDYVSELNDYLDGELAPELCQEIEKHVGKCENCRIMINSMKQTVELVCEGKPAQLPEELQARLNQALKKRWEAKFGKQK